MLHSPDAAEEIAALLETGDFYSDIHRRIFVAAKDMNEEGLTPNAVSIRERTGVAQGEIDMLLEAGHLTSSQVRTLIQEIRRIADLRTIHYACQDASSKIGKEAKVEEILESLEGKLYGMDRAGSKESRDGADVMKAVVEDFLRRYREGGGPEISTGIKALDRAIIGLRPGKVGVIAGRPGMGKTALTSSIRRNVVGQGIGVCEFNLEMQAEELMERELAFHAQLNLRKVMAAKEVTEEEVERVRGAGGAILSGLWSIDDSTYSIAGIRRRARIVSGRMARAGVRLGLVILDYIQLAGDNGDGREQSVAAISRGCKLMAKELGCTVLALSQLNRSCELRDDRRPILSDLRESGTIEQDADWVGFVYREHQYDSSFPAEDAEFIIRKQRSGPTGTVRLHYNPKLVTFGDVPCENYPPETSSSGEMTSEDTLRPTTEES